MTEFRMRVNRSKRDGCPRCAGRLVELSELGSASFRRRKKGSGRGGWGNWWWGADGVSAPRLGRNQPHDSAANHSCPKL